MSLLHVSILHRHGARGPGGIRIDLCNIYLFIVVLESELSIWEHGSINPVLPNWTHEEQEVLVPSGREMINTLGGWFFENYFDKFPVAERPVFHSSSSGRGKESGLDFISGYNKSSIKV